MSEQIQVRSACEPCHERKIRCITGTQGGPCQNCQSRNLNCFFLPRFKSGRRPHKPNRQASSTQFAKPTEHSDFAVPHTHTIAAGTGAPNFPVSQESMCESLAWAWDESTQQIPGAHAQFQNPSDDTGAPLSMANFPMHTTTSNPLSPQYQCHESPGDYAPSHNGGGPGSTTTSVSQSVSWSSRSRSPPARETGETKFTDLLHHCTKIQMRITTAHAVTAQSSNTSTPHAGTSNAELARLLEDIEGACNCVFSVYGSSTPPKTPGQAVYGSEALMALANAMIIKLFQLYELLLDHGILSTPGLDTLHSKRLNLCNIQLQIVIARIQQLNKEGAMVETSMAIAATLIEEKLRWLHS